MPSVCSISWLIELFSIVSMLQWHLEMEMSCCAIKLHACTATQLKHVELLLMREGESGRERWPAKLSPVGVPSTVPTCEQCVCERHVCYYNFFNAAQWWNRPCRTALEQTGLTIDDSLCVRWCCLAIDGTTDMYETSVMQWHGYTDTHTQTRSRIWQTFDQQQVIAI